MTLKAQQNGEYAVIIKLVNKHTRNMNRKFIMRNCFNFIFRSHIVVLCLFLFGVSQVSYADVERGLAIAKERKLADEGWGDTQADMRMILRNAQGQESERIIRVKSWEMPNDGDKALTIFDKPRDVSGTAFLSFSKAVGADDQWIYLPALKRVKRINSKNKSGPFMGSEFAFEDMTSFEVEKYTYNYLGDQVVSGRPSHIVEQMPVDKNSGYTRQKVWIDQEYFYVVKIEFYDRKDKLLKILDLSDFKVHKDKFWRAHQSEMYNEQTGKSTVLIVDDIRFDTGLSEDDFNSNKLRNVR